jgi:hypothetical protein
VGFNPHRKQRRSPIDYFMVGAAMVICVGLITWAFFG